MLSLFLYLIRMLGETVRTESRLQLLNARKTLPLRFRTSNQFLGAQYAGCGATIGVMPRCDFACNACYLGKEANRIPMESVVGIKQQLDRIRLWLGPGGNVQITDGEVTLRPVEELLEIIRYARNIKLVPMLMTHGDALRKNQQLLLRLVREAGLSEISIHIDTTQRGRFGKDYKYATYESDLRPLREEFGRMMRHVRKQTGQRIKVAMTVTVTEKNLTGIPEIVQWVKNNSDIITLLSFQPVAQVGRTHHDAESVTVDKVWAGIAAGLYKKLDNRHDLTRHHGYLGHADCTRFVQGLVVTENDRESEFYPLFRGGDTPDQVFLQEYMQRFGGISTRIGKPWVAYIKLIIRLATAPTFVCRFLLPFIARKMLELKQSHGSRLLWRIVTRRLRIHYLNIISHHFMSRQEIDTPRGQERTAACVFKVPINGEMISMCEVNAQGYRENYYARLKINSLQTKQ